MDLYMSYEKTSTFNGDTFHYMRVGLFTGTGLTDLLLLLADVDEVGMLSLPAYVPKFIASGTQIRKYDNTLWTAPTDLYLLYIESNPFSSVGGPVYDFLDNAIMSESIAVYGEVPAVESPNYPPNFSPTDKPPNVPGADWWYVPSLSTKYVTISSKKSSFPFWTYTCFALWSAYGTGTYNCEGLPYNIHCTCFPNEYTVYNAPTNYREHGYWRVDGYYRDVASQETTWMGFPLTIDPGTVTSLQGEAWAPQNVDDPVIYFEPTETVERVGDFIAPLLLFVLPVVMEIAISHNPSKILGGFADWKILKGPKIYAPVAGDRLLTRTDDLLLTRTDDRLLTR